jgi:hypothetical protein
MTLITIKILYFLQSDMINQKKVLYLRAQNTEMFFIHNLIRGGNKQ